MGGIGLMGRLGLNCSAKGIRLIPLIAVQRAIGKHFMMREEPLDTREGRALYHRAP